MPASADDFHALLEANLKVKKMDKMVDNFEAFFNAHADVVAMLPRILERGGPDGQNFCLSTAQQVKNPALLSVIKDFALSQNGTDDMRFQAAKLAHEAQLMPKESVSLWLDGEWREIALQAYTFHNEPPRRHSKAIERLAEPAFSLLNQGGKAQAIEAEALLRQALKLTQEAPDLMNNLAMALSKQGREDEAEALIHEIVASYPDYVFASVSLARRHLVDGEIEAAEAILKPFLSRDRFHIMEFGAFADTYISLLMLQNKKDVARSWFEMWEKVYPEDTKLDYWRSRLKKRVWAP
jgi:tetratricopeptide (TPR) repeat protein